MDRPTKKVLGLLLLVFHESMKKLDNDNHKADLLIMVIDDIERLLNGLNKNNHEHSNN